jgi:hypothetical protein
MTLFPPAREEGRALRWGARRLPSRRPGKAPFLSILGWGISRRWHARELPSTRPQARVDSSRPCAASEHSRIGQRTKRRRSLLRMSLLVELCPLRGPWERPLSARLARSVPLRPGEGPLTEPTPAVQPPRPEQLFMPQSRPSPGPKDRSEEPGKRSFDPATQLP